MEPDLLLVIRPGWAGPAYPPYAITPKQPAIYPACPCQPPLPPKPSELGPAYVSVKELRRPALHLAIPDMLAAGIVELDDLRRHTAMRDLLRVHMLPAFGDIAKGLIAPSGEASGGQ